MGDNDRQAHQRLLETGTFRRTKEQDDTMNLLLEGTDLSLEENVESTLELPQMRTK